MVYNQPSLFSCDFDITTRVAVSAVSNRKWRVVQRCKRSPGQPRSKKYSCRSWYCWYLRKVYRHEHTSSWPGPVRKWPFTAVSRPPTLSVSHSFTFHARETPSSQIHVECKKDLYFTYKDLLYLIGLQNETYLAKLEWLIL